jgi:hypothetical protein
VQGGSWGGANHRARGETEATAQTAGNTLADIGHERTFLDPGPRLSGPEVLSNWAESPPSLSRYARVPTEPLTIGTVRTSVGSECRLGVAVLGEEAFGELAPVQPPI